MIYNQEIYHTVGLIAPQFNTLLSCLGFGFGILAKQINKCKELHEWSLIPEPIKHN